MLYMLEKLRNIEFCKRIHDTVSHIDDYLQHKLLEFPQCECLRQVPIDEKKELALQRL